MFLTFLFWSESILYRDINFYSFEGKFWSRTCHRVISILLICTRNKYNVPNRFFCLCIYFSTVLVNIPTYLLFIQITRNVQQSCMKYCKFKTHCSSNVLLGLIWYSFFYMDENITTINISININVNVKKI